MIHTVDKSNNHDIRKRITLEHGQQNLDHTNRQVFSQILHQLQQVCAERMGFHHHHGQQTCVQSVCDT